MISLCSRSVLTHNLTSQNSFNEIYTNIELLIAEGESQVVCLLSICYTIYLQKSRTESNPPLHQYSLLTDAIFQNIFDINNETLPISCPQEH